MASGAVSLGGSAVVGGLGGEYEATIYSYRSRKTWRLRWSSINWQRKRNDVSEAKVTAELVDGVAASDTLMSGLEPWACELRITRNGVVEWIGPVVGWERPPMPPQSTGTVTITARDRTQAFRRRVVSQNLTVSASDLSAAANTLISTEMAVAGTLYPVTPTFAGWGVTGSRTYRAAGLEILWDCIQELTERGLYWTMVAGTMIADKAAFATIAARVGVLTEVAFLETPAVSVDGLGMVNVAYVGASDQTDTGFAIVGSDVTISDASYGILVGVEVASEISTQTDANAKATATKAIARYPALTIETARLSPSAPIAYADLVPGINVTVSFDESRALGALGAVTFGLQQVDVAVSVSDGLYEEVSVTLGPATT